MEDKLFFPQDTFPEKAHRIITILQGEELGQSTTTTSLTCEAAGS